MRELVANQLNTMLISDVLVGQMIERLKADGHWGNTIIFFLSDHGALFPRAKPDVLRGGPARAADGGRAGYAGIPEADPARHVSMCSRRGTAANGWWTGRAALSVTAITQPNFRDAWPAIIRTRELYERGELTPTQALAYGPRPAEELYDLKADPHETVNLADDPDHQEILKAMRALVEAWIADTDDKGQYPESKAALAVTKKQFQRWCTDPIFDDV